MECLLPKHPNHALAGAIMFQMFGPERDKIVDPYNEIVGNSKPFSKERMMGLYGKKYLEGGSIADELAMHMHHDGDYTAAADQLDRGSEEYAGLHDMVKSQIGKDHPLVQILRNHYYKRQSLISEYKHHLGIGKEDVDNKFNDITKNLNIGQQFNGEEPNGQ